MTAEQKLHMNNKGERNPMYGKHHSAEAKKKIGLVLSKANKGRKFTEEHKNNMKISWVGRKGHEAWNKGKEFLSGKNNPMFGRKGEKSPQWRGGISSQNEILRHSLEYKLWRDSVFTRDNYTCIWCGKRGIRLEADHIKPWAWFPELRFAIDNGRTLCLECHKKTDTYKKRIQ